MQASGPSEPGGVASGVQQLRRSTRPRHAPTEWWSSSVSYAHVAWQEVPKTFSSTHVSSDVHEWQAIGESELPVVPQTYCALPLDMESARCRLLHEMSAEEGLYGAPIRQIAEGYNSDEVLAPHANNMSAHVLSGFEAAEDVEVTTLDVKTVFQRVELERELLMHKDQSSAGISQTGSTGRVWVCRLRESLYSLEQVSRFWPWSVKINSNLKSLGYAKSVFALGVAVYKAADWLTVMIVYADSLMTYSEGRARGLLKSSADSLRRAELTELGVICSCLAISVVMYRASGVLYSSQVGSVMTLPTMLSLSEREPIGCIPDHKLTTHLSPITPIERKNMAATLCILSKLFNDAGRADLEVAKKTCMYLKGTTAVALVCKQCLLLTSVFGYCDAGHESYPDTSKGISWWRTYIGGTADPWRARHTFRAAH